MAGNVSLNNSGRRSSGKGRNSRGKTKRVVTPQDLGYTQREWDRLNARDRQERKRQRVLIAVFVFLLALACILGYFVWLFVFRSHDYRLSMVYNSSSPVYGIGEANIDSGMADGFADNLCVTDSDQNVDMLSIGALGAGLFDITENRVIYAKDVFTTRSPASLTKIMTAMVALKYANPDDIVTITETVKDIEFGSSVCDVKPGDQISLKQLLYGLIVASGNDAAMAIAEYVGGSVDNFVALMNQEAYALGATRTHFNNPHGLTDPDHYTCIYDMYLMFRAAMKYDMFMDMINRRNYYAEYRREDGSPVAVTWESTNHYFTGEAALPENVIIYGGKTGTTEDAGACLILLVKDLYGNPYIAVLMHSGDKDILYTEMNGMLSLVFYS